MPTDSQFTPYQVAKRIHSERLRLGLTQDETAERLGVSRSTYRQLEKTANPRFSTIVRLVRLGMRPVKLFPELDLPGDRDRDRGPMSA